MEMDSVEVSGPIMDLSEGISAENSVSPKDSDVCNVFGDPDIIPRVGDEYQVEIPCLMTVSDYLQSLADSEVTVDDSPNRLIGLSVPLVWISEEKIENESRGQEEASDSVDVSNNKNQSECIKEAGLAVVKDDSRPKVELKPLDVALINGTNIGESVNLVLHKEQNHGGKGHCLVPGCSDDTLTDHEEAVFLLGLYIFGKNLVLVKKFLGSKQMGDILSYYYGRFYQSDKYRRWAGCPKDKKKNKRTVCYGQKIFSGLRHQELLSRLLPHVSEKCRSTVLEVCKTYGEGKISLDDYVTTLKSTCGQKALVEAIGIGKGKQDLTGVAMDTPKSNPVRREMPIGKACSALTPPEIVNFLTGDFRLSKARSSDLFWEAVWPRLLARGWHSEQPNNHAFSAGSKHSLVFLLPGIKKFSRRKQVKGYHYFDSISDVLREVASDPGLLDIESYKSREENGWSNEAKLDQNDFPNEQRHCYLKPRTPNRATDTVKFTVVDTSLANGRTVKVRELRSLPTKVVNTCTSQSPSDEDDEDSSEESADKSSSVNALSSNKDENTDLKATDVKLIKSLSFGSKDVEHGPDSTTMPAKIPKDKHTDLCNGAQPRKGTKSKLNRKEGPESKNHLAPAVKRRRKLHPLSRKEKSCNTTDSRVGPILHREAASCVHNSDLSDNMLSQVDPSQEKLSSASSSRGYSPIASAEGILSSNEMDTEQPHEKPPSRTFIDLNIAISPNAETDEPLMAETTARQDQQRSNEPGNHQPAVKSSGAGESEQEANVGARRQSTRNRPLTTKVLEAFACGFMDTKQKRKTKDTFPGENLKSRPPLKRPRPRLSPQESFNSVNVDFSMEQSGTSIQNANSDVFNQRGISSQTG